MWCWWPNIRSVGGVLRCQKNVSIYDHLIWVFLHLADAALPLLIISHPQKWQIFATHTWFFFQWHMLKMGDHDDKKWHMREHREVVHHSFSSSQIQTLCSTKSSPAKHSKICHIKFIIPFFITCYFIFSLINPQVYVDIEEGKKVAHNEKGKR